MGCVSRGGRDLGNGHRSPDLTFQGTLEYSSRGWSSSCLCAWRGLLLRLALVTPADSRQLFASPRVRMIGYSEEDANALLERALGLLLL